MNLTHSYLLLLKNTLLSKQSHKNALEWNLSKKKAWTWIDRGIDKGRLLEARSGVIFDIALISCPGLNSLSLFFLFFFCPKYLMYMDFTSM